jgi:hypothetical protein
MGRTHFFEYKSAPLKPIEEIRLSVRVRSQGAYVASVPLKRLIELSKLSFHSWRLEKVGDCWWLVIVGI